MNVVETVEKGSAPLPMEQLVSRTFLAKITASVAVNDSVAPEDPNYENYKYIWQYAFSEVIPTWLTGEYPAATSTAMTDGESGSTSTDRTVATCAFNIVELANTSTTAGPGVALSDTVYPTAVANNTLVFCHQYWDPSGVSTNQNLFTLFSQDNPFTCDEGTGAPLASRTFNLDLGTFISSSLAGSTLDFGSFT